MKMTNKLNKEMHPKKGVVYGAHSLPSYYDTVEMRWNHPDELFEIRLDRNTNELTGMWYDWNEDHEEWENVKAMTDDEIASAIAEHKLLMVTRG